jgi:hypothetical protein
VIKKVLELGAPICREDVVLAVELLGFLQILLGRYALFLLEADVSEGVSTFGV